ncbi:MAG: hypothetical protein ACKODS_09655 [Methylophilaceae bacterium]
MSHPDPLFDPDNAYEDDFEMMEDEDGTEWMVNNPNYDDYNDFHSEEENEVDDVWDNDVDDSMDGDFDSAMRDAGFGTDEDYGYYGEDY